MDITAGDTEVGSTSAWPCAGTALFAAGAERRRTFC